MNFIVKPFCGLFLCLFSLPGLHAQVGKSTVDPYGAVIRGPVDKKEIALVFTGDEFADGGEIIRMTLMKNEVKASFFLTGNFYTNPSFHSLLLGLKADGHYMGGHSDKHLLYADWIKRDSTLVSEEEFKSDLRSNYSRMRILDKDIDKTTATFFLPPYEWYNKTIAEWTRQMELTLVNFTPGTISTTDYTFPGMGTRYRGSAEIYQSILSAEVKDPKGLNGFILLIHIGTDPRRTDKFYDLLDKLLIELKSKGYTFVRIDKLLRS